MVPEFWRNERYFDMNSGEIFPSQADSNRAEFYDVVSCQTLPYCGESVMQRENRFVVIPDRLLSEAARLSYAVSRLGCNGLNIHVFTNGQVDRKKTLAQNPCMKDIAGANQWAESREPSLSARL